MTDAELLQGARAGNAEAWRTLYGRYLPLVWREAYARVKDIHVAEDITSEALLALLRSIKQLETDGPAIGAWLRSVVEFKSADFCRKQIRTRDGLRKYANLPSTLDSPAAFIESEETCKAVRQVLAEMPNRLRAVLEAKYLDAMPVRDLACHLGETEKAIESLLYRARREFRRLYQAQQKCAMNGFVAKKRAADVDPIS